MKNSLQRLAQDADSAFNQEGASSQVHARSSRWAAREKQKDTIMNILLCAVPALVIPSGVLAQVPSEKSAEKQARQAVQSFYNTFNAHDWDRATEFTTKDWTHLDLGGGWTRGREAVLKQLKQVHATFLKGVTVTPEEMEVRFATPEVAVVTVPSKVRGTFTTPDGLTHENERQIRTFVVVKRGSRWLIMQD
jgi:uncharacterized protein (TIGR02246 family)